MVEVIGDLPFAEWPVDAKIFWLMFAALFLKTCYRALEG